MVISSSVSPIRCAKTINAIRRRRARGTRRALRKPHLTTGGNATTAGKVQCTSGNKKEPSMGDTVKVETAAAHFLFMTLRDRFSATKSSFQISAVALSTRLKRFAAVVLSRTAAKGLSTTFVVRRCFQWSSGKSAWCHATRSSAPRSLRPSLM